MEGVDTFDERVAVRGLVVGAIANNIGGCEQEECADSCEVSSAECSEAGGVQRGNAAKHKHEDIMSYPVADAIGEEGV